MSKKNVHFSKNRTSQLQKDKPQPVINLKAVVLKTRAEKTKGLIGVTKLYPVYFETRFGIHTFGMQKPIDVFILDSENRIVRIKNNLQPGNVFFWNPKFYKVLEGPVGFLSVEMMNKIKLTAKS